MGLSVADVEAALRALPFINSFEEFKPNKLLALPRSSLPTYKISASYEENTWDLAISVPDGFPYDLPRISLLVNPPFAPFGHLNWRGSICYKDTQGLAADIRDPVNVLKGCIVEALETLKEHSEDSSKKDLHQDFEDYWESLPSDYAPTLCFFELGSEFKTLTAFEDTKNSRKTRTPNILAIVDEKLNEETLYAPINRIKGSKQRKIPYIPLADKVEPPPLLSLWTAEDILEIIKKHAEASVLERYLDWIESEKWSNFFSIIFSHPKPSGEFALWGVRFHRKEKAQHPAKSSSADWCVVPLHLRNQSPTYLKARGGANTDLSDKKVLLFGCGSVGSYIAMNLAKSGVGEIHLVDTDILTPENIHRHALGASFIDPAQHALKVDALKWEIELNIPGVKVVPVKANIRQFIEEIDLDNYDTVISSTGDFSSELALNIHHHESDIRTPVIYAWQDGFGIGGHVMQVARPEKKGCLECLYTRSSGFKPHPRTSFIAQGQTISKHVGGCGGVFTPYSNVDALQTSILATRAVLGVLNGQRSNTIYSWRGTSEELEANGHQASNWYKKAEDKQLQDEHRYIANNCKACGSDHSVQ
ncbi:ThiF family adenylyltransferase [uncultured Pseudoteredinibacter sp.]|uniref:ThiF family adenylyltransferase n=1 Tax=uncultured Pseudoteredinibacter sp. TaxID=1641701 RepID=UPI00260FD9F7|nr:ThiF family adenylyltransferase [uncultured Pseudoteredinibacter sp.]